MPSPISTSRKFSPAARTTTRTCPAPSGAPLDGSATTPTSPSDPPAHRHPPRPAPRHQPRIGGHPPQPPPEHPAIAHHHLRLPTPHRRHQHPSRRRTVIDIGQHEPARMLRLRAAHQPLHRRPRQPHPTRSAPVSAPARTAPRVTTTSTDEANRSPATHPCTRPSTQHRPHRRCHVPAIAVADGQTGHHHTGHLCARIHRRGQLRQPGTPLHHPRPRQPRT